MNHSEAQTKAAAGVFYITRFPKDQSFKPTEFCTVCNPDQLLSWGFLHMVMIPTDGAAIIQLSVYKTLSCTVSKWDLLLLPRCHLKSVPLCLESAVRCLSGVHETLKGSSGGLDVFRSGSTPDPVEGCSPWKAALALPAVQLEGLRWLSSLLRKPVSQRRMLLHGKMNCFW